LSDLEWRDDFPVSKQFDDPYYSIADGREETDHVFIKGNHLDTRWPNSKTCSIAELGFGTGLNFLETARQWQALNLINNQLHFTSFEQYPITQEEITKALSHWPELSNLAKRLVEIWQLQMDTIDVEFTNNIRLTVHEVGKHTAPNGTFATYTAAGFVKRGLQAAGFKVEKTKGFGKKRDMLIGKMST